MYNLGIRMFMNSWYDIVKSYDDPKSKDPNRRDDGTYSQFSVIMLLIYLMFGRDYAYNIASYFDKLSNIGIKKRNRSSTLWHSGRIATLLNNMWNDELIICTDELIKRRTRKYYQLNPEILRSPSKDKTYFDEDNNPIDIPLNIIESYLSCLEKYKGWYLNTGHERRDEIFQRALIPDIVDYFTFLYLLKDECNILGRDILKLENMRKLKDIGKIKYSKPWPAGCGSTILNPEFSSSIFDYIEVLKSQEGVNFDLDKEHEFHIVEWR